MWPHLSFSALNMVTSLARSFITTLPSSLTTLRPVNYITITSQTLLNIGTYITYQNGILATPIPMLGSEIWNINIFIHSLHQHRTSTCICLCVCGGLFIWVTRVSVGGRGGICPPLKSFAPLKSNRPSSYTATCVFMLPPKVSRICGSPPLVTFSEINPGYWLGSFLLLSTNVLHTCTS